jgi:Bifunctional DNA primase/polymerase, N-terminal
MLKSAPVQNGKENQLTNGNIHKQDFDLNSSIPVAVAKSSDGFAYDQPFPSAKFVQLLAGPCPAAGSDKRDFAEWLTIIRLRVFRLGANEKKPIRGSHPIKNPDDSTCDPQLGYEWWTDKRTGRARNFNIGIRTDGRRFVVIDLDVKKYTLDEQQAVLARLCGGETPVTWTVRTQSGGW